MTDSTYVDPNTDDLDAFNDLLNGTAKPLEETQDLPEDDDDKAAEDDDSNEEDTLATDEDDTGEESEDDESDDEDDEDESLLKVKPKKTFQDRINELTAKAREAERREADLARKLEETIARLDKNKEPEPKPTPQVVTEGPSYDDLNEDGSAKYPLGEFDPNYVADITRFTIRKELNEAKIAEQQDNERKQYEAAQQELQGQWLGKVEESEARLPDFREKVQNIETAFQGINKQYGEYLAATIMSMDYGPDVLYYLSNNIAEAKKIAASGPTQATIALGRVEARFALADEEKKVKKIKVSDAPTPPPSNTKGNKASREVPDDTDDLDAFEAKFYKRK